MYNIYKTGGVRGIFFRVTSTTNSEESTGE